jgi:hypothetical protein
VDSSKIKDRDTESQRGKNRDTNSLRLNDMDVDSISNAVLAVRTGSVPRLRTEKVRPFMDSSDIPQGGRVRFKRVL